MIFESRNLMPQFDFRSSSAADLQTIRIAKLLSQLFKTLGWLRPN